MIRLYFLISCSKSSMDKKERSGKGFMPDCNGLFHISEFDACAAAIHLSFKDYQKSIQVC